MVVKMAQLRATVMLTGGDSLARSIGRNTTKIIN